MADTIVDGFIRVAGAFSAKLPYRPVVPVFSVQEGDKLVQRVAVG